MKTLSNFYLLNYFLKIVPKYLASKISLKLVDGTVVLQTDKKDLMILISFLKYHWNLQYKTLVGITVTDYPNKKKRFKVSYFLLSYKLNNRIILNVNVSDKEPLNSISHIYEGANWYEREVWDLFGIFFLGHPDLRRILTDYGFEGFPFRKDFPQTGFVEVRYDDEKKYVLYENLEITQEYRFYKYLNPWSNIK